MKKTRKAYTAEFKREAVRLVKGGLTASQVARDLGLLLTWWPVGSVRLMAILARHFLVRER